MVTCRDLVKLLREDDLKGDPWGTAMGAFFDVSEELSRQGEDIPSAWGYRPGAFGVGDTPETWFGEVIAGSDPEELIRFGNILHRYTAMLDRAGRSY